MSTKTAKAQTRKAQPKKTSAWVKDQPQVTPIPKRARGAAKLAEAQARRPVPVPPTSGLSALLPQVPKTARAKADAKKAAAPKADKASKRVSGDAIPVVVEVAKMDRTTRVNAAKAEHESMHAWAEKGKKGTAPATPVLDWLKENPTGSVQRRSQVRKANAAKNGSGRRSVECTVVFYANDKPKGATTQSVSSLAWQHTKGVDAAKPDRISPAELRALLAANGITEPETTEWEFTLSNGIKLAAKKA